MNQAVLNSRELLKELLQTADWSTGSDGKEWFWKWQDEHWEEVLRNSLETLWGVEYDTSVPRTT